MAIFHDGQPLTESLVLNYQAVNFETCVVIKKMVTAKRSANMAAKPLGLRAGHVREFRCTHALPLGLPTRCSHLEGDSVIMCLLPTITALGARSGGNW